MAIHVGFEINVNRRHPVTLNVMFLQVFSKNVFGNLAGLRDGAPRRSLRWLTSPKLYGLGLCGFERAAIELHRDVDDA